MSYFSYYSINYIFCFFTFFDILNIQQKYLNSFNLVNYFFNVGNSKSWPITIISTIPNHGQVFTNQEGLVLYVAFCKNFDIRDAV